MFLAETSQIRSAGQFSENAKSRPSLDGERLDMNAEISTGVKINVKDRRPAIYQLEIVGVKERDLLIQQYWWVKMTDLMKELCGACHGLLPSVSYPKQVFDRYGLLCGCTEDRELLTWAIGQYEGVDDYASEEEKRPPDCEREFTYVPLGFSSNVIKLAEKGVVSVTAELATVKGLCHKRDRSILRICELTALFFDGSSRRIISQGRHGPHIII